MKDAFISKVTSREAVVGVIGLGYVGLPLILEFARERFPVIGFDVDQAKVDALSAGASYISHIPADAIQQAFRRPDGDAWASARATHRLHTAPRVFGHSDLRSHAADAASRSRPVIRRRHVTYHRPPPAEGPAGRLGVDDLSRDDRGCLDSYAGRDVRSDSRHGLHGGILA